MKPRETVLGVDCRGPICGAGVLSALLFSCLLLGGNARALQEDDSSLYEQVKSACPRYSFYGENFLMGVGLLNVTITESVGDCCSSCIGDCYRWSWCPTTNEGGCIASAGPLNATLFLAGTCLHSNNIGLNSTMLITYSRQQPGEPWVSGIMAAPGNDPVTFETAAESQDYTEYLNSASASWFLCRQVARGSLQLSALNDPSTAGPNLTQGQQVNYTGIQLADGSGGKWAVVLTGPGPDLFMYPANDLAFCPQGQAGGHQQCAANLFGSATEEGASCSSDSDCCASLVCRPRAVGDIIMQWPTYAGPDETKNLTLIPGEPWSPLPNECVRKYDDVDGAAGVFVASTWNTDNNTAQCSVFNLTALQNNDTNLVWTRNASSTWPAPQGNLLVTDSEVQSYRDELCASLGTANATLVADVAAEGADAQKAYLAMFAATGGGAYACPGSGGTFLAQIFVDYVGGAGATVTTISQMAQHLVDAAASAGSAACVSVAVVQANLSSVIQTIDIHTSPGTSSGGLPNGTVRLSGNESCTQGTADVVMAGSWGAVCSWGGGGDAVHQRNAQVVCRSQGVPTDQPSVTAQTSRAGAYVWIKDLNCTGSESSILDCPHTAADGSTAGSEDCLALNVNCGDSASATCSQRPGRCQKLAGSCDPAQGYCAFQAQPAGTACLGGTCDASGQCVSAATS